MSSSLRSPKTLSRWLELDYFERPRPLRRLWPLGILLALLVSGSYVAWALASGRHTAFQAGPVSSAHAAFNNDCAACHTGPTRTFHRLVSFDPGLHSVPDDACRKCHEGARHHDVPIGEQSCVSCHREHRGAKVLARVDSRHCTDCHADPRRNFPVSAFALGDHPEFRLFRAGTPVDPGRINFNHDVHLKLDKVRGIDRKLACQDCHQADPDGRRMQPIRFDRHCKECHPLAVQLAGAWKDDRLTQLARTFADAPLPHPSPRETPEVVRAVLRDRLSRFIARPVNRQAFLGLPPLAEPERPVPGAPRPAPPTREEHLWIHEQQAQIERVLFDGAGGCRYCHHEKGKAKRHVGALPEFFPSNIPTYWYRSSRFSHHAHRMLDCAGCHPAALSKATSDVLIPYLDTCLKCHAERVGKARSDCVECHGYHDPTEQRAFRGKRTIEEFIEK
jgi:hypothetical protein